MDDSNSRSDGPPGNGQVLRLRKLTPVRGVPVAGKEPSAGDLFTILWLGLADVLGTAAAATLLRRAAQRAAPGYPELVELVITRENLEYRYVVPPTWNDSTPAPLQALRQLTRELWTFLIDLTGSVVVNRLSQIAALRDRDIVPEHQEQS
jgi:hypothetical protein